MTWYASQPCAACLRPVGGSGAYIITRVVFCPACARRALAVLTLWDEIHNSPLREAA